MTELGRAFRTLGLQIGYRYEGSPILVPDGFFDVKSVGARLAAAAAELPPEVGAVILEKVNSFKH